MNCPQCLEDLSAYIDDMLLPAQKDSVYAHLQTCSACAQAHRDLLALHEALAQVSIQPTQAFCAAWRETIRAQAASPQEQAQGKQPLSTKNGKRKVPFGLFTSIAAVAAVCMLGVSSFLQPKPAPAPASAPQAASFAVMPQAPAAPQTAAPQTADAPLPQPAAFAAPEAALESAVASDEPIQEQQEALQMSRGRGATDGQDRIRFAERIEIAPQDVSSQTAQLIQDALDALGVAYAQTQDNFIPASALDGGQADALAALLQTQGCTVTIVWAEQTPAQTTITMAAE